MRCGVRYGRHEATASGTPSAVMRCWQSHPRHFLCFVRIRASFLGVTVLPDSRSAFMSSPASEQLWQITVDRPPC
jgi:hypothetical protein